MYIYIERETDNFRTYYDLHWLEYRVDPSYHKYYLSLCGKEKKLIPVLWRDEMLVLYQQAETTQEQRKSFNHRVTTLQWHIVIIDWVDHI